MERVRTKRKFTILSLTLLLSALILPVAGAGEVIDRIVATVNGHIILQSDWDEALSYEALLNGRSLAQLGEDDRRAVLDRLIDQELLRGQMKAADFQHASVSEASARVADARRQYPEAAGDQGWQALLAKYHLTEKDLLSHVQQQIDVMRLVDAHLRPAVQIDAKTIETYYRENFVPQLKQSGAGEPPLADVSSRIRELLIEQKVSELLVSWLQALRSEGDVRMPAAFQPYDNGVQTR
jgi:peptidyl-prolyl cis-trans isomerase SurA